MLASWLKSPAGPDEILLRQQSIAELRSNLDLREELAILGGDVRAGVEPDPLIAWGEEPDRFQSYWISAAAAALALLAVAGIVMWAAAGYRELFFAAVFGEVLFAFSLRLKLRHTVSTAESIGRNLSLLSMVLGRLEKEDFKTPHLRSLRTALESEGILVKLRNVSSKTKGGRDTYEILVLESEASQAREILLENGLS